MSWGAAPAPDALLREMSATFPGTQILAAFGQTEMSPVTCMLLGEDAIRKRGSVGKVIPTVAARVVDENMNDVPVGEVGEIVYRAPTLMSGYWNNPEATAEAFAGGWFHSGDLVRMDEDGYVWVVDRKKDMIISGGENIYCAEVENVLASHPSIVEVAVIGAFPRRSGARCRSRLRQWTVTAAARRAGRVPDRTARTLQASQGARDRGCAAPQPRREGAQDRTADPLRSRGMSTKTVPRQWISRPERKADENCNVCPLLTKG